MAPFVDFLERANIAGLSPLALEEALKARDTSQSANYQPGRGTVQPTVINNNAVFALFGLLGAGFVISSIWFFFWAKNGGFRWRKGDWDDYKSTVLRRKGPNGTLLSGATKSTRLGDGSVVGSLGSMEEYKDIEKDAGGHDRKKAREKQVKNSQDKDVRAYRHEKVAKVGGLNREAEGSSYTDPTPSDVSSQGHPRRSGAHRSSRRDFAYAPGNESTISGASDDSRRPLRASRHADEGRYTQRPIRHVPRSTNQRYSSRMSNGGYTEPLDFHSQHDGSVDGGSEQARNSKSYHHPLPGLGRASNNMPGSYRRDYGGRDGLSDEEGEGRY